MNKEILDFYNSISQDQSLKERLSQKIKDIKNQEDLKTLINTEILPLAKKHGFNFTVEDFLKNEKESAQKLPKEDLLNINGGISLKSILSGSILSLIMLNTGLSETMVSHAMDFQNAGAPVGNQNCINNVHIGQMIEDSETELLYTILTLPDQEHDGTLCAEVLDKGIKDDIVIPQSVTINSSTYKVVELQKWAFRRQKKVASVTIPDSVTNIDDDTFLGSGVTKINVSPGNKNYSSIDGVLFNKDQSTLIRCPACRPGSSYEIPNKVHNIRHCAFSGCYDLTSVIIPDSVEIIEDKAFNQCRHLTSISIPNSVKTLNSSIFLGTSLKSVFLPSSVTSVNQDTFGGCGKLTEINVSPDNKNYSSIDGILFNKDQSTLIFSPSLKSFNNYIVPDSVNKIEHHAFLGNKNLTSITIPNSVQSIGNEAFAECYNLESISMPDSVKDIGSSAFFYCQRLSKVVLPNALKSINENTFSKCPQLKSIAIPASVNHIDQSAFSECPGIAEINVSPDSKKYSSINGVLFDKTQTSLLRYPPQKEDDNYVIPNSVVNIQTNAFHDCTHLKSVVIPNHVQIIPDSAFFNCSNLNQINIPNSVKKIEEFAFNNCSNLNSIIIPRSVKSIGVYAFSSCTNLTSITIPNSLIIHDAAFDECQSLKSITITNSFNPVELKEQAEQAEQIALKSPTIENWFNAEKLYQQLFCEKKINFKVIRDLPWRGVSPEAKVEDNIDYELNDLGRKVKDISQNILNQDLDSPLNMQTLSMLYEIDPNYANQEFCKHFEKLNGQQIQNIINFWQEEAENLINQAKGANECNRVAYIFKMLSNFFKDHKKSLNPANSAAPTDQVVQPDQSTPANKSKQADPDKLFEQKAHEIQNYRYLNRNINYIVHNEEDDFEASSDNNDRVFTKIKNKIPDQNNENTKSANQETTEASNVAQGQDSENAKLTSQDVTKASNTAAQDQNNENEEYAEKCVICLGKFLKDQEPPVHLRTCNCTEGVAHKECMLQFIDQDNSNSCPCCKTKYK